VNCKGGKSKMVIIYKNKGGFKVKWKHGMVSSIANGIKDGIVKYGLSDEPDIEELKNMAEAVFIWMDSKTGGWNIGYPVYANDRYFGRLKKVVKSLWNNTKKGYKREITRKNALEKIIQRIDDEALNHYSDVMSS